MNLGLGKSIHRAIRMMVTVMDHFKYFTKLEAKVQNKHKLLKNTINKMKLRPLFCDFSELLRLIS